MRTLARNRGPFSSRRMTIPGAASAQAMAAKNPAAPPPTTTTSGALTVQTGSHKPDDGVRDIILFQRSHFLRAQLYGKCGDGVVEVVRFGCADDRRRHERLLQHPGQRDLRPGNVSF